MSLAQRPEPSEHVPYYGRYIVLVPDGDVIATLGTQIEETLALLSSVSAEKSQHRYAPGKWSVRQLVGHVADSERVFGYRALAFARGDQTELPGFDENDYAEASPAANRPLPDVVEDLAAVRRATLSLLRNLEPDAWSRAGKANASPVSVRALAWIIAGHERHHRQILRERYLGA
ncbi:MAG TPA: DinB family protein [Vicinamibacteria bacterium]